MARVPHPYGIRPDSRTSARAVLALALALALAGTAAAHPGHEGGLYAALVGVEEASPGAVGLRVLVVNNTPGPATLRGLSVEGAGAVGLVRRRRLLGLELSQPVRFLQVDSGERVLIAEPDYSVSAEGLDLEAVIRGDIDIIADFGPLGELPLEVVGAPQTTE
jgi:hypothetical protein